MRVFVTVAKEGGFAAASRALDISPAAVTRAIVALETQLGISLMQRTTRKLRLTDAGSQYFADCKQILTQIQAANEAASGINAAPSGRLTITAPVLFGRMFVMPSIMQYMQRYPQVQVLAHFVDRLTNVVEEEIDVAIRIGHLPDSSLRAIKVGQVRQVLCAAPAYLQQHGRPLTPAELHAHAIVASSALAPNAMSSSATSPNTTAAKTEWGFADGEALTRVTITPRLMVSSNDAALSAAVGGLGITRLLSYQVKQEVERGNLELLLETFEQAPWPVHVVHREDKHGSSKVRSFIDEIVDDLRGQIEFKV